METKKSVKCTQCGYVADLKKENGRCPRCYKILVTYQQCSGNCTSCKKNAGCK